MTKRNYGWPEDAKFLIPDGVYEHFQNGIGKRGKALRDAWSAHFDAYRTKYPALADEISIAWSIDSFPRDGTRICRRFLPTRRAWPRAIPPAKSRTPSRKMFPG